MKTQAWACLASIAAVGCAIAALLSGEVRWAAPSAIAAIASWFVARYSNRKRPAPFPFALPGLLHLPRPYQSCAQLDRILEPRRGERLLEIGPGIGAHALPIASSIAPDGVLDVLDAQRNMLEEVNRRARAASVTNITARQGDAAHLPYADRTFDGAYMIGVLGEIPDGDGALRELLRVLKQDGRLVIGEVLVDPDYVPPKCLQLRMERAGFVFGRQMGGALAYLVRFERR